MSGTGQLALQSAIYQVLSNDPNLMELIDGIYDKVPDNAEYPYLVISETQARDWSTSTTTGAACVLVLRIFSREAGRKQAAQIMEQVHALLHAGSLTVTGYSVTSVRFESSDTRLQDDGATYQAVLRFRVLMQNI